MPRTNVNTFEESASSSWCGRHDVELCDEHTHGSITDKPECAQRGQHGVEDMGITVGNTL